MSIHTHIPQQQLSRDPDLVNAEIALKRAAINAHILAKKNGTAIVICEKGVIKEIHPDTLDSEAES